jgi:DNA-binding MarR family transcriptional regulator
LRTQLLNKAAGFTHKLSAMASQSIMINKDDSRESIGRWISMLHKSMKIYVDKELEKYGIGMGQFPFFMVLFRNDGLSQEALTSIINVDKATTTRAITKLEQEGYVVRENDSDDKRVYKVFLTPKGRGMKPVMKKISDRWNKVLLDGFDGSEKSSVQKYLQQMVDNASMIQKSGKR